MRGCRSPTGLTGKKRRQESLCVSRPGHDLPHHLRGNISLTNYFELGNTGSFLPATFYITFLPSKIYAWCLCCTTVGQRVSSPSSRSFYLFWSHIAVVTVRNKPVFILVLYSFLPHLWNIALTNNLFIIAIFTSSLSHHPLDRLLYCLSVRACLCVHGSTGLCVCTTMSLSVS